MYKIEVQPIFLNHVVTYNTKSVHTRQTWTWSIQLNLPGLWHRVQTPNTQGHKMFMVITWRSPVGSSARGWQSPHVGTSWRWSDLCWQGWTSSYPSLSWAPLSTSPSHSPAPCCSVWDKHRQQYNTELQCARDYVKYADYQWCADKNYIEKILCFVLTSLTFVIWLFIYEWYLTDMLILYTFSVTGIQKE